jgi:hypothetical protein
MAWKMMSKTEKVRLKQIGTRAEEYGLRLDLDNEELRIHEHDQRDLFEETGKTLVKVVRTGDHTRDLTVLSNDLDRVLTELRRKKKKR